jgi:hypothetical protein
MVCAPSTAPAQACLLSVLLVFQGLELVFAHYKTAWVETFVLWVVVCKTVETTPAQLA